MPDDPREILKAAGVECAEVDEFWNDLAPYWCPGCNEEQGRHSALSPRTEGDAADAILALARLVAQQAEQLKRLAPKGGPDSRVTAGPGCEHGPWQAHCK